MAASVVGLHVREVTPRTGAPAARGRVVIEGVRPAVDGGAHPAKGALGLPLQLGGTVIADGHDRLLVWARHGPTRPTTGSPTSKLPTGWSELLLEPAGNDLYVAASFPRRWAPGASL